MLFHAIKSCSHKISVHQKYKNISRIQLYVQSLQKCLTFYLSINFNILSDTNKTNTAWTSHLGSCIQLNKKACFIRYKITENSLASQVEKIYNVLIDLYHCPETLSGPLRKHAYSNNRKFHLQKLKIFRLKSHLIFHISAKNIDCGYSLEPPLPRQF